jgi:tetratricopeptide (TPR) repeat protein
MLTDQTIDPNQKPPSPLLRPLLAVWHWMVPPTQAHADRQSRTTVILRSSLVIITAISFVGGVLFWGRDARDLYQDWQADGLVSEARRLADEGNVINAVLKAQEAYSKSPENEGAIRLNAEFLTLMKRQEAVFFHELLEKSGAATSQDAEGKIRALLNLNREKEASDTLEKLMKKSPPTDGMFKLAETVWGGTEQNGIVLKVLKEYCENNPADMESLLRLAKFQVISSVRPEVAKGMETLWMLAQKEGEIGIKAIDVLNGVKQLEPEDMRRLVERLENHPRATGWHQVAAMKRKIELAPSRRSAMIQEAVAKYQGLAREERLPFVRWLVEEREFRQVLSLVEESDALAYQPLLLNYLSALTMLGRFDDLGRMIENPKAAEILTKTDHAFYQAHLAFVRGRPRDEVRQKLSAARIAAQDEGRADMLLLIGDYAEKRNLLEIAIDAYDAVSKKPRMERPGFEGLVRVAQLNGNMDALLKASREAIRRWPDDENFMERYLYASLLAGKEVELSLERTLKLLEKRPKDSPVKVASALGYFRFGDLDMSLNHMQGVDLNKCTAGQQAVFAFFAKLGGYDDAANLVIKAIPKDAKMLPEEVAFYNKAKG